MTLLAETGPQLSCVMQESWLFFKFLLQKNYKT